MLPSELRNRIRNGEHRSHTSGVCQDYVQTNLVVLPKEYAFDFLLFTTRNPKSCPIVEVLEAGEFESTYGKGSDIRTDIPLYHVYEHGQLAEKKTRIDDVWGDDLDDLVGAFEDLGGNHGSPRSGAASTAGNLCSCGFRLRRFSLTVRYELGFL